MVEQAAMSSEGPTYVTYFNDSKDGLLEHSSETKQFIVPMGSTIHFRVRFGSPCAQNPILLVNLPEPTGSTMVTATDLPEPTSSTVVTAAATSSSAATAATESTGYSGDTTANLIFPEVNRSKSMMTSMYTMTQPIKSDGSKVEMGSGWPISTTYLQRVAPDKILTGERAPATTYFEFTVRFSTAGSFFVQLEHGKRDQASDLHFTKPSYINVEPLLALEPSEPPLKCKELSICTVLSRSLGPLERWPSVLATLSKQGYNAVHFTPIQQYGESFSHYSLADQTDISDYFYTDKVPQQPSKAEKFQQLQHVMATVRQQQKLFSIIDIVLNHTASNSAWVQEHPEACYSTDAVPRLYPAYLLDTELFGMSKEFSRGDIAWCPSAPYLKNELDLGQVVIEMELRARQLNLHEFFLCSFDRDAFMRALPGISQCQLQAKIEEFKSMGLFELEPSQVLQKHFLEGLGHGPDRNQVKLKQPDTSIFFTYLCQQNVSMAIEKVEELVSASNLHWTTTVTQWVSEAIDNCKGTIRYFKLELKRTLISDQNYLLDPYFQTLNNAEQSKVVHNGWISDHDPRVDFALEQDFPYLRRHVNIWGDSIKLRYGDCPASSPYLWQHMGEYVTQMATLFDGFRLDNAHSTPIHVCQYMLQVARCRNPNLFVMAELFTSSAEMDALFTTRLNINGMIREMMNKGDVGSVSAYFHEITCREAVIGKLDSEFESVHECQESEVASMYRVLRPTKPSDVIYDCTHDNPSPLEKFGTRRLALPTIGLLSLADQIIASTWGYDQLLPENLCVVKESRLYPAETDLQDLESLWPDTDYQYGEQQRATMQYVFRYKTASSAAVQSVSVAGEFNAWQPTLEMQRKPNSNNEWLASMEVDPNLQGRRIQFKFVEDGSRWTISHDLPKVHDSNDNENNFFQLGDSRTSFDPNHKVVTLANLRVPRMLLNKAHLECTKHDAGIFMHSQTNDTIVIVRQLALDYCSEFDAYVTVQRFPFAGCNNESISTSVELPGFLTEVIFAANMTDSCYQPEQQQTAAKSGIIEAPASEVLVHNSLHKFACVIDGTSSSRIEFFHLPQAFTCLLKTRTSTHIKQAVSKLDELWEKSAHQVAKDITAVGGKLGLPEINHLLYRCADEEKDISGGQRTPYGLPDEEQFVYAGLQGPLHTLQQLKLSDDMGHALLDNIRRGDWLLDYTQARIAAKLVDMPSLQAVHDLMNETFANIRKLPSAFKPRHVTRALEKLFNATISLLTNEQMGPLVAFHRTPDPFLQGLVLACAQMYAIVPSSAFKQFKASMCAGLPHFSTGYMRCWGRDTFISLRGLLLTTGLFQEAKDTILFFAKVERHGLLPNLHDQGSNTRFNARDATWFFLQAIKDYIMMASDGLSILAESFEAEFESQQVMTIGQQIMKILKAHADGINFRELNAGTGIDEQMKDKGFNVQVEADLANTGFCFGGNTDNCGTWMDKMGSQALVNKGVPATPRDGAPVELVGLQYSVLSFLAQLHAEGKFAHEGVQQITFQAWADLIKANFNRCFYVPEDISTDSQYDIETRFVNRRGIYKDVYRSAHGLTDYQLRPNLCIAMAVAPELFDRQQAQRCLQKVEEVLMVTGAMGIKTLDPSDEAYRGDYDNDDITRGQNYHQGPEWVWPLGFFLISKLNFFDYGSQKDAAQDIVKHLLPHQRHMLKKDPWHSLPELTNSDGKPCHHSCPAQAWSIATILDALHRIGFYEPLPALPEATNTSSK